MGEPILEDLFGILAPPDDLIYVNQCLSGIAVSNCAGKSQEKVLSRSSGIFEHQASVKMCVSGSNALLKYTERISDRTICS